MPSPSFTLIFTAFSLLFPCILNAFSLLYCSFHCFLLAVSHFLRAWSLLYRSFHSFLLAFSRFFRAFSLLLSFSLLLPCFLHSFCECFLLAFPSFSFTFSLFFPHCRSHITHVFPASCLAPPTTFQRPSYLPRPT